MGSCLTLGSELPEETHVLTKQKALLERGAQGESSRVREPRRTALPSGPAEVQVLYVLVQKEFSERQNDR